MHRYKVDYQLTPEDKERVHLLTLVRGEGLKSLSMAQLERLQELVSKKDYSHSRKAQRAKRKLLNKINVAIYEAKEGRQGI